MRGLRDYVDKNGFRHVVLGLSGGIDSALVACLAADALGPERVTAVIMPSPYSSEDTRRDARMIAERLSLETLELPIDATMEAYTETLAEPFSGREARHHRGEPAGAHPRQPADGAVQQVRLARAHHRQQVGDVGGLLHALRRHGGRLRRDQGRPQDARVPAGRVAQRGGGPPAPVRRAGAHPALDHRARTIRRAAPRPARRGLPAAIRRSIASCRPTSRRTAVATS